MKFIKITFLTILMMGSGLQGMELWKRLWAWGKDTQNPLNLQLLDAVEKGEIRYLGLLIGEGADVNAQEVQSAYQDTALIIAAKN